MNQWESPISDEQIAIFQTIAEAINRVTNLPTSIWVLDKQRQTLRIAASIGLPASYARQAFLTLDEPSVTGEAFKTGKATMAYDILSDPRWKHKQEAQEMGWKAALCVPFKVRGAVMGVISIYTFVAREFTELEKQLLSDYATQISLTFEAEGAKRTLLRLLEVVRQITQVTPRQPEIVLEEIVKSACELIGADCAVLYPYDYQREEFYDIESVAAYGLRHELRLSEKPRKHTGMAAYVIKEGEVIRSDIEKEDPDMLRNPFIEQEGIRAFMGVSLRVGEEILGVLYVNFRAPHQFTYDERNIVRLFANQAAIALYNSRLYAEAQSEALAARQLATLGTAMAALQHRINNTFNIIVPNVMRLRRRVDPADTEIAEILDIIERNARLTSEIIARIQEPLREMEPQEVDINAVISETTRTVAELWEKDPARPKIQVTLNLDDSIPRIRAPIGQIAEIFRNLVDNAYRAMQEKGGRLTIDSRLDGSRICIRVQDTGPGIPPQIQQRLFIRPVPSRDPREGAGLGLWLSRLILESLGGTIGIEKTDHTGTTMLVQIPAPTVRRRDDKSTDSDC